MSKPVDLKREQRGVVRGAGLAAATCLIVVLLGWLSGDTIVARSDDPLARLLLALRLDLALLFCLVVALGRVANGRFASAEDIGAGAAPTESAFIRERRAQLQNTLEQVVLALPVHLVLATLLPPDRMGVIAALVLLFVIGRIAFTFGYARGGPGRAFGFGLTFYPTAAALLAAILLALGHYGGA